MGFRGPRRSPNYTHGWGIAFPVLAASAIILIVVAVVAIVIKHKAGREQKKNRPTRSKRLSLL